MQMKEERHQHRYGRRKRHDRVASAQQLQDHRKFRLKRVEMVDGRAVMLGNHGLQYKPPVLVNRLQAMIRGKLKRNQTGKNQISEMLDPFATDLLPIHLHRLWTCQVNLM